MPLHRLPTSTILGRNFVPPWSWNRGRMLEFDRQPGQGGIRFAPLGLSVTRSTAAAPLSDRGRARGLFLFSAGFE